MSIARQARFSAIHVFPYSPRASTVAASLPDHVAPTEQKRRVDALLQLARELSSDYAAQFLEQTVPVLVETSANGAIEGMTPHYVKARVPLASSTQGVVPGGISGCALHSGATTRYTASGNHAGTGVTLRTAPGE
jgi:threonylcarbamoyladenosine tRNA methylthiotransferase MtaB